MSMSVRLSVVVTALLLLLPAGAEAATTTVTRSGNTLTVTSDTSVSAGTFRLTDDGGTVVWEDAGGGSTSSDGACAPLGAAKLTCGPAPLDHIDVHLTGGRGASVTISAAAHTIAFTGSDGADTLTTAESGAAVTADLGGGNDDASTGPGADVVHGGSGDDTFELGKGDDVAHGDGGNDTLEAEDDRDGTDVFDGGTDGPASIDLRWGNPSGDTVSYGRRDQTSGPITVTLPPDTDDTTQGGNGAPGEDDRLAHVENVIGEPGYLSWNGLGHPTVPAPVAADVNHLTGNDRGNYLRGGIQADVLAGAGGDDTILSREETSGGPGSGAVSTIDCGAGDDAVRRNVADRSTGCEHDEPGFIQAPGLAGQLQVGGVFTANTSVFGDVATQVLEWQHCNRDAIQTLVDCVVVGTGSQYTVTAADVNHTLQFVATVTGSTPISSDRVVRTIGNVPAPVAPQAPAAPLATRTAAAARSALGTSVVTTTRLGTGPGTVVFEPSRLRSHKLRITRSSTKVLAIACDAACSGTVTASIRVTTSRGAHHVYTLRTQKVSVAAGRVGVVRISVSGAVRRAMHAAKTASLTLRGRLTTGGTTRHGSTTFGVAT